MQAIRVPSAALGLAVLVSGCGGDEATSEVADSSEDQVVEVTMVDVAFEPEALEVGQGETVTFRFTNTGEAVHEAFIGDESAQEGHQEEMNGPGADGGDMGGMGHGGHDESDEHSVTVDPGDTAELTYTFETAGSLLIGCHQPGHWEAGMKVEVEVA